MKSNIAIPIIMFLFIACDYHYQKQIGENYFIRCIETRDRMDIGFGTSEFSEGLIGNTVFEVHWNDKYILAKRHTMKIESPYELVIEYYIVNKVKFGEANPIQNMSGPLDRQEYEQKKIELELDEDKMESIIFKDLVPELSK